MLRMGEMQWIWWKGVMIMQSPISLMSPVITLILGNGCNSVMVDRESELWSEFSFWLHCLPAHWSDWHIEESSPKQPYSMHLVLFWSGIPPTPLLNASPWLRQWWKRANISTKGRRERLSGKAWDSSGKLTWVEFWFSSFQLTSFWQISCPLEYLIICKMSRILSILHDCCKNDF